MGTSNRTAAFIAGAGHSGSTLLGLTLGAHPEIFYAGEARKSIFLGDADKPLKKRVCKLCGEQCVVWSAIRPAAHPERDLYQLLSEHTQKSVILDSTKKTDWIEAGAARVRARGAETRLFCLWRDGRAVVNSRVRKYPEITAAQHTRDWKRQIEDTQRFAQRFAGEVLQMRYEALASSPAAELERAAEFLDLRFSPEMLTPWLSAQHPLGGNSGTQWVMAPRPEQPGSVLELGARTRRYYETHPRAFVLDLRWRYEMTPEVLAAFEAEAGDANRPYAWDEPVST